MRISLSPKFLSVLIHDLKNPLNVIGLTVRLLEAEAKGCGPEFEQDLAVIRENAGQINQMLIQLNEYARLYDDRIGETIREAVAPFDPRRFLAELIEAEAERAPEFPVGLEILETCPREVSLDQLRARLAISNAILNAQSAAGGGPVQLRAGGEDGRWILELIVPQPAPAALRSMVLSDEGFDRLRCAHDDRRALDLAMAARVSELFGGSAHLEVAEAGTAVVLDWPTTHPAGPGTSVAQ